MEKILIIETQEVPRDLSGFSRVVSTIPRPATDYLYDLWDPRTYGALYDEVFAATQEILNALSQGGDFRYRDVALPSCLRHEIFLFMLSAEITYRAYLALRQKFPNAKFHIQEHVPDFHVPYLFQVLDAEDTGLVLDRRSSPATSRAQTSWTERLKDLWPARLQLGLAPNARVAIYADYYRSSEVMKRLSAKTRLYFTTAKEPKVALLSGVAGHSYCQTVYSPAHRALYSSKAAAYKSLLTSRFSMPGFFHLRSAVLAKLEQDANEIFPVTLFHIDEAYRFFEQHPALENILLDEDISYFKHSFSQVASIVGRKCFVECHGAVTARHGFVPVTADHIFVWGARQRDQLIKWGCSNGKIILSGCSKYAKYKRMPDAAARKPICKVYGLDPKKKIVLLTPFPREYSPRYFLGKMIRERVESILDLLSDQDIQILIKLHPCEMDKDFYRSWIQNQKGSCRFVLIEKFDPLLLVKACDLAIVHDSTMAVDAFALERNVIFFPVLPPAARAPNSISNFDGYRVFHTPATAAEFRDILGTLVRDPSARPAGARWEEARRDCLNEGEVLPEEIIASCLSGKHANSEGTSNVEG